MFHLALLEIFHTSFPFLPKCKKTLKIHVLHLNSYLGGTYNLPGVLSGKKKLPVLKKLQAGNYL